MLGLHIITLAILRLPKFYMDNEPLQYIEGENNNRLTDLLQNYNSEEEYANSTLNNSPYYDHNFF